MAIVRVSTCGTRESSQKIKDSLYQNLYQPFLNRYFICRKGKIQKFFLFLLILCFQTKRFLKLETCKKSIYRKDENFYYFELSSSKNPSKQAPEKKLVTKFNRPNTKNLDNFLEDKFAVLLNAIKSMRNFIGRVQSLGDTGVAVMITSVTAFVSTSKL